MSKPSAPEKSEPYPIRITASLEAEIQRTMGATELNKPDTMRSAMRLGLPLLRKKFPANKKRP